MTLHRRLPVLLLYNRSVIGKGNDMDYQTGARCGLVSEAVV